MGALKLKQKTFTKTKINHPPIFQYLKILNDLITIII